MDRGWYSPGQPGGGVPKPFTYLAESFLPKLRAAGFDESLITQAHPYQSIPGLCPLRSCLPQRHGEHRENLLVFLCVLPSASCLCGRRLPQGLLPAVSTLMRVNMSILKLFHHYKEDSLQKHPEITRQRLQQFAGVDGLRGLVYPRRAPVALTVYAAPDRISYAEAMRGAYHPAQVGEVFGPPWSTHWFRVEIDIPREWAGQEVHFLWDSSSEAAIWLDGEPRQGLTGSERAYGSRPEPLRPAYRLTRSAQGGEKLILYVEMACNRLFGVEKRARYVLDRPKSPSSTAKPGICCGISRSSPTWPQELPANTPRGGQALYAANQMVNTIHLDDRGTWAGARKIAANFSAAHNGDGQLNLSAHRPRPHRHRLAVAAGRDAAQVHCAPSPPPAPDG